MAVEIERKFLVIHNGWQQGEPTRYVQGYLNRDKQRTVRVRIAGDKALLTVKGETVGMSRAEYEYEIPLADAKEMLSLCDGPLIEKDRWHVPYAGFVWEVDVFFGENEGLVIAEIELESEAQEFDKPDWLGEEVTADNRYFNSSLCAHPYKSWI